MSGRCSFVTEPAIDRACDNLGSWNVFYRVGTSHILHEEPFVRCRQHLGATVERLGQSEYPYYLDRVESVNSRVPA